ncbi:MAG TPA: hypothetical protein VIN74_07970 [Candidatus Limnocylindria bacterium]
MARIPWRTSLPALLVPAVALAAAVGLGSRWSSLDPVEASIVERWLPLAALLVAAVAIGSTLRSNPLLPLITLVGLLAVAVAAPGESHIRLGWIFLGFVAISALLLGRSVWLALDALSDRRAALILAAVALAVFLSLDPYHRAVQPTQSDEPHYLLITQSIVLDGDVDLANDYAGQRYRSFYDDTFPDVHAIQVGPHFYPIRDLGLPVAAVPFFAISGRLGVMVLVSLVGAALVAELYLLMRDLDIPPRVALVATGLVALLHPVLTYAGAEVEPELFAALLFVVAVRALRHGTRSSARALAVASACAGLIGIFTTRGWFLSVGIGLCVAVFALAPRRDLVRRALAGAVPFLFFVLLISYADCLMFPFGDGSGRCYFMPSAGYYLIRDQQTVLSSGPLVGLAGLLFDRTFGLVSHVPLYLLAFAGIVPMWRRARRGHGAEVAVLTVSGLLLIGYISDIAYWWADGMPSSRYLVAPLPLLGVLLALGIEALVVAWRRVGWGIVAVLVIPSALVTGLYTVQPELGYDLAVDVQRSGYPGQLWAYVYEHWGVDPGLLFPSLVRPDGALPLVAWCAIALGLVALGAVARPALRPAAGPGSPASSGTG